jgi:hypothetical protein
MSGNARGALVAAARRIGEAPADYAQRIVHDEKWCTGCRAWHPIDAFGQDASRPDGRAVICPSARGRHYRKTYIRRGQPRRGWLVPARDGDKLQARRRINYLVESGQRPHPNDLPCIDCSHIGQDRRHEYDHFEGYSAEHQLDVEPVCSRCHAAREKRRRQDLRVREFPKGDP